jgi:RHS repeat-associated protein
MGFPGTFDGIRQKFTSKERDNETGLDYFGARYYGSLLGRFTSCDPKSMGLKQRINPQRWSRYTYSLNSPLSIYDPDGQDDSGQGGAIVIDIFISHDPNLKGDDNLTKAQQQKLDTLIDKGAKKDIEIRLHDRMDASAEDADRSLATKGNVVMFAGHTARQGLPDGTQGPYLGFASDTGVIGGVGIIYSDENNRYFKDPRQPTEASLVLALGCESSSLRSVAAGADNYIGVNGAPSTYGQYNGIIAAVEAIVTSGRVDPEAVRAASESAIRNNPEQLQPDSRVRVILNPARNVPTLVEAHIRERPHEQE